MSIIEELERHWGVSANGVCHCGCGGNTLRRRAHFIPGHDPFFAPNLLKELRGNLDVEEIIRRLTGNQP